MISRVFPQTRLHPPWVKIVCHLLLASCLILTFLSPAGKITLPSTVLQFWDLGGQTGIRNIWHRYYNECHAVAYVVDAQDRGLLEEGWEVFGEIIGQVSSGLLNGCK